MPDYDFHTLTPPDFEELTRDLLQASQGVVFQAFKTGRDRGVDLRYASDDENRIVQCKHWRKSGFEALLRELKSEAKKVARMNPAPTRYFLVTSVELSNANKEEMAKVLGISNTQDILGGNDLNNLLGLHREVEERHYKLWLPSTAILQRVLHTAEAAKSDLAFKRIHRQAPRFVQTRAYLQAVEQLGRDRVLVLSGLPGVGKSAIADFLLYQKVAEGYQPVIARDGFEAAAKLHIEGMRQVFLYDDFLGATFLGEGGAALVRNEDRVITDFLNLIADDVDKLLILTTREHILTEAVDRSERLRHASISDYRYVVRVGGYTAEQRARILYNHAYFNGLAPEYLARLRRDDFFFTIIEHPKFSPRVVEWLTSARRVTVPAADYQAFAMRLLDDPAEIWRHAYDHQISHAARSALLALHSLNGRVSHARMHEAFDALHAARAAQYGFTTAPDDYLKAMRVLNSAFVTITHANVDFIDPSVRDLMNTIVREAPDNALDILRGAVSMIQVSAIWTLAEARGGEAIEARIETGLSTVVDGVRRALEADLFVYESGAVGVYTPVIEIRLSLLADMAGRLENRALDILLAPTVARALEVWRTERPDPTAALRAIELLRSGELKSHPEIRGLSQQLLSALATQSHIELEPNDLARTLSLQDRAWTSQERAALRAMASGWLEKTGDYLRACQSDYELEHLAKTLREVQAALDVDLRAAIEKVGVELRMFEPEEERDEREPERPDPRDWAAAEERAETRALFNTLRAPLSEDEETDELVSAEDFLRFWRRR